MRAWLGGLSLLLAACAAAPAPVAHEGSPPAHATPDAAGTAARQPHPAPQPAQPAARKTESRPLGGDVLAAAGAATPQSPAMPEAPVATEPVAPGPALPPTVEQPEPPAPDSPADALADLRAAAAGKDAPTAALKALAGALIGRGDAESLREAEQVLAALQGRPDVSARWLSLMRAAVAEAGGADAEVEAHARAALAATLAALPVEVGTCHIAEDLGGVEPRESISFRPDDYVSVALQARCFGVTARPDGRWDYRLELSARLLDEQGNVVSGFAPPAAEYRPGFASCAPVDHPGDRWTWFVFFIEQRLPLDLKAGNYVLEVTLRDKCGKEQLGDVTRRLDLRVR